MGDNKQAKFTSQGVNCFELIHPQAIPDAFNRDKRQNRDRPFLLLARRNSGKAGNMRSAATPDGFHLGKIIKQELARQGRTAVWLAKQVNCTPENLYKIFNQQWVTMPLLYKISEALDYDFFKECSEYFQEQRGK